MKPVCSSTHHPPTLLQLSHRFTTNKVLPCSFPFLRTLTKTAGRGLLRVHVHRRCLKPLRITVFLLNKDGGAAKTHEDEWCPTNTSNVKLLLSGILQRWGPPAAVGAMVGSIVAQKKLVFIVSFSFVLLMAVHKAVESQGVYLKMPSRQLLINLLVTTRSIFSTVAFHLSGAFIACFSKTRKFLHQLSILMSAVLANALLSWNPRQSGEYAKHPARSSAFKSADTIISDISACIQSVEGQTEKDMPPDTRWTELKDSLSSLQTKLALLSKADSYIEPPTDELAPLTPALKESVKKLNSSAPAKSKRSNPEQSDAGESHAVEEDKRLAKTSADMLNQEAIHEMPGELDATNELGALLTGRIASTKEACGAASEVSMDITSGLPLKATNGIANSDAQILDVASVKVGESKGHSPRTKHIDYWTEQYPSRSVSPGDMEVQKSKALWENLNCQNPTGDQDFEKEIPSKDAREAADRIYLAAIDKFEAMMGISQRYAPGAMLNWGLTLKDRSRLRPLGSAERLSLLQQAKQLLLDALRLQPDDAQIHSAFVTCCVELKELNERQQPKRTRKSFFGK